MGFSEHFDNALREKSPLLRAFELLLEPMDDDALQSLAAHSASVTRRHFGRTMRLFAPLYVSNECINSCAYCGFSRENAIQRVTLTIDQVEAEARHLTAEGFRNILLVAGEHPKFVSVPYLTQCVERLRQFVPSLSIEVAPMETAGYLPIVRAGTEGLIVYQETYHRPTYAALHLAGPKKNYAWRLDCPERGYEAGFRRLGIGALFGLWHWKEEALALAAHLEYLQRVCWKAQITVSMPRLRPAAGEFQPSHPLPDREFIQLLCALRVTFPTVGIVLSTREPAPLRDLVAPLGVTLMSAGSHTEPGGYTGPATDAATEQFAISDIRCARSVESLLNEMGLEPVWKDWDAAILGAVE
jgi:2-iminoacetate synthase